MIMSLVTKHIPQPTTELEPTAQLAVQTTVAPLKHFGFGDSFTLLKITEDPKELFVHVGYT